MGTLHLVRHGQASFGAADYDQLSPLGQTQCRWLGEHWQQVGRRHAAVYTGRLRRHRQSWAAIAEGLPGLPEPVVLPELDEYDADALVRAHHPGPLDRPATPEQVRRHFRLLREALLAWTHARIAPEGMPTHRDFVAGIAAALDRIRRDHDGDVLIVSSGGPISHAVGLVLGTGPDATIDLNMRLRNSAVSEFSFNERRHSLVAFNAVPHLERPDRVHALTHA